MRRFSKIVSTATILAATAGSFYFVPATVTADTHSNAMVIEEGEKIAFNRKKGNCLACHAVRGGDLPGNIAPPLVAMKQRYPDKAKLRAQIWDATAANPNSMMPPFGRHKILTESEIDKIVEFVYQL